MAVTALLWVLLSPVSWIHHFVVVIVAIGAILADGRSPRRVALAAATAVFFALTIPWWGQSLLSHQAVPALAARVVQDAFGIAAVVLVVILARLPAAARRAARSRCRPRRSTRSAPPGSARGCPRWSTPPPPT
jgi:alpha-1,2-mannosyltransferase